MGEDISRVFEYYDRMSRVTESISEVGKYGTEPYATDTPLVQAFGESPKSKTVAALLSEDPDYELNEAGLAKLGGLTHEEVLNLPDYIEDWEKNGLISRNRDEDSGEIIYSMNRHQDAVEHLRKAEKAIVKWWYSQLEGDGGRDVDRDSLMEMI